MEQFNNILQMAAKVYLRNVMQNDANEIDQAMGLLETARGIRPYLYFDEVNMRELWEKVRSSEIQTLLVLDSATQFHLTLSHADINPETLITHCVSAFTLVTGSASVADDVLQERAIKAKSATSLLQGNFWFVFLYLLGIADNTPLVKFVNELSNGKA